MGGRSKVVPADPRGASVARPAGTRRSRVIPAGLSGSSSLREGKPSRQEDDLSGSPAFSRAEGRNDGPARGLPPRHGKGPKGVPMASNVETIRHSASHVLAEAVQKLYPGTKFGIGPAIEDGFYYDFQLPGPIQPEDLPAIEKEMRRIISGGAGVPASRGVQGGGEEGLRGPALQARAHRRA